MNRRTITLAFTIFNKERWVKSLLESWLSNLSNTFDYEIIIVFDACKDNSEAIAKETLQQYNYPHTFLYADDQFEIYCNNLALEHSTGDYILFIQDDNWIYDKNWDATLMTIINQTKNIGAIALLAGVDIHRTSLVKACLKGCLSYLRYAWDYIKCTLRNTPRPHASKYKNMIEYSRIEIDRPHKGENFSNFKLPVFEFGVWNVTAVTRPFAIERNLLQSLGGLGKEFMPLCGDDMDLSLKLRQQGKNNLYIPFDLLNICGSQETMGSNELSNINHRALRQLFVKYRSYLIKKTPFQPHCLTPLYIDESGSLSLSPNSSKL